jgi:putative DNA primase/helicase
MSTPSQIYERVPQEVLAQYPNLTNEYSFADTVMAKILSEFTLQNSVRVKGQKLKCPQDLPSLSIAVLIAARSDVALVSSGDKSQTDKKQNLTSEQRHSLPIGIYQTTGDNKGVYEITNDPYGAFGELVERYKPDATRREKLEVFTLVKSRLKVVEKCVIPYYVAVNNGIWDVGDKILHPFSQDLVFTSKIHTNLNLAASNPVITIPEDNSTWDVDTFFSELGSPEFVESIKEVIQAACLPCAEKQNGAVYEYSRKQWQGYNLPVNPQYFGKGFCCQYSDHKFFKTV